MLRTVLKSLLLSLAIFLLIGIFAGSFSKLSKVFLPASDSFLPAGHPVSDGIEEGGEVVEGNAGEREETPRKNSDGTGRKNLTMEEQQTRWERELARLRGNPERAKQGDFFSSAATEENEPVAEEPQPESAEETSRPETAGSVATNETGTDAAGMASPLSFDWLPWQIALIYLALFVLLWGQSLIYFSAKQDGGNHPLRRWIRRKSPLFADWAIQSAPLLGLVGTLVSLGLAVKAKQSPEGNLQNLQSVFLDNFVNALDTTIFGALVYVANYFLLALSQKRMAKTDKAPSLIVLMDLLLVLVFLMIQQPAKETYDFVYPPSMSMEGIKIWTMEGRERRWFQNQPFGGKGYAFGSHCDPSIRAMLGIPPRTECGVVFHGASAEAIARLVFQTCATGDCGQMKLPLDERGRFDLQRFVRLNQANPYLLDNPYVRSLSGN